jgi:PIN domain nuclease of toxin-antitoxin system
LGSGGDRAAAIFGWIPSSAPGLLDNGYDELPITGKHTVALDGLPPIHKDPFDRMLIVQSMIGGITLLTTDPLIAQYPAPFRKDVRPTHCAVHRSLGRD